jgi:hypothetical protein
MRPILVLAPLFASLLAGCSSLLPSQGIAKAQETAQAFNQDARFGRNELVLDQIAPAAREEFSMHHRAWGVAIHVADIELAGIKAHGATDVDVVVHVSWYRPETQELRSTMLTQSWHNKVDTWQLVGEKRMDGDIGLLGEAVVVQAPSEPKVPSQFPTIRLGGGEPVQD